jgi:hypothetical protein
LHPAASLPFVNPHRSHKGFDTTLVHYPGGASSVISSLSLWLSPSFSKI